MSPFCRELDVHYDETPRSAAMNMAIDEALLEQVTRPTLRFYRWDHPALSFGYFGRFADVKEYAADRDIVRRWTGGGIVFHGDDLTYALIIPVTPQSAPASSQFVYATVHQALRDTLVGSGRRAELAVAEASTASEACFERPVVADVLLEQRKVAGAAHRRSRRGLLHQGSIQSVDFSDELARDFSRRLARECHGQELAGKVIARAREIAASRYATESWLTRR